MINSLHKLENCKTEIYIQMVSGKYILWMKLNVKENICAGIDSAIDGSYL